MSTNQHIQRGERMPLHEALAAMSHQRHSELKTRIFIALFGAAMASIMAHTMVGVEWLGMVLATQLLDTMAFSKYRKGGKAPTSVSRKELAWLLLVTAIATATYSFITVILWMTGGVAGKIFAMVWLCGSTLHVTLHLYHVRPVFLTAVTVHASYLLGLPLVQSFLSSGDRWSYAIGVLAATLYLGHLVVAYKQNFAGMENLRKAHKQALQDRQNAEKANAAKSAFLATMSHELRTPMNAVLGTAELLRRSQLDDDQKEHVKTLVDAGQILLTILNDVLDLSKIEAGKMEVESIDLDVRHSLRRLERLWAPRAEENGVTFRIEVDDAVPAVVRGDPTRVRQILFNLISNAVKFTENGEIVVRVGAKALDEKDGQSFVRLHFSVSDTGVGIDDEAKGRLFAAFEQADGSVTRRFGGTGLGLAISKRLANLMNGDLSVESELGFGSCFTLTLDVEVLSEKDQGDVDTSISEENAKLDTTKLRVLIAEDNPLNQKIITAFLRPFDHAITMTENGQQALDALSVQSFDLVLMDVQMPVMDGLTATRDIRASSEAFAAIPVIAMTANAMSGDREMCLQAGMDEYVTKPIDPRALYTAMARARLKRAKRQLQEAVPDAATGTNGA